MTKTWSVDCHCFNEVPCARHWHAKSEPFATVGMVNVGATDVEMKPFSKNNPTPKRVRRAAEQKHATRLTNEWNFFIQDEISRRERLEFDPSKVASGSKADIDSDDEEEENS